MKKTEYHIDDIRFYVAKIIIHYSKNFTVTPERTFAPKSLASQLVNRIQPCEAVLEINDGFGVPCIPNDFLLKPIQILPTGPFGPGGKLSGFKFLP